MTVAIVGYVSLALLFWAHALYRLSSRGPRERLFGLGERILLGIVALGASALWVVFVPIYVAGMVRGSYGKGHDLSIGSVAKLFKRARSSTLPA